MADSHIAWCDKVWNPTVGCTRVSDGCAHCYAEALAPRLAAMGQTAYEGLTRKHGDGSVTWTGEVRSLTERLEEPLKWRGRHRVFVNSMSDLFHESVPSEFIGRVFGIMALASLSTFQVLTKRPERMRDLLAEGVIGPLKGEAAQYAWETERKRGWTHVNANEYLGPTWPLRNVWLGVSVENQAAADARIPILLQTPAAVRFISAEPLLGPVNLRRVDYGWQLRAMMERAQQKMGHPFDGYTPIGDGMAFLDVLQGGWFDGWDRGSDGGRLDWVITGGESGPHRRPFDEDWARAIRDQCQAAGVAYFHKQSGGPRPGMNRELDGRLWEQFPEPARDGAGA